MSVQGGYWQEPKNEHHFTWTNHKASSSTSTRRLMRRASYKIEQRCCIQARIVFRNQLCLGTHKLPFLSFRKRFQLYVAEFFFRSLQSLSYSQIPQKFTEPLASFSWFTRAPPHWSLSWVRWVQSMTPHPPALQSISILSSHLHIGVPNGLLLSGFPTKIPHAFTLRLVYCHG
jgi:hypothetical protein